MLKGQNGSRCCRLEVRFLGLEGEVVRRSKSRWLVGGDVVGSMEVNR
jgi:hypothetical protein